MPKYKLTPRSTVPEIVDVMKKLRDEAKCESETHAAKAFFGADKTDAYVAHEYEGKREMLSSLIWALGGMAEEDGCEGEVDIH